MRRISERLVELSLPLGLRRASRTGAADTKTVVIIVLAVIGGISMLGCGVLALLLVPAISGARDAARITQSRNNLKQIGLALHNYHDVFNTLPPGGIYAEDGTPYHGWQTSILPFVDQAPLYNQIDFNRPWTDPVNTATFQVPVLPYQSPFEEANRMANGGAASHYAGNQHVMFENSSLRIYDAKDGTSNTLLAGEVGAGYKAWGDPSNVRDPGLGILGDATSFGRPAGAPDGCIMLLMDGSVREISKDIDPAVLKALSTPDGGEAIGAF
jgi:type II secretory pathway pseudopilin PulG